MKRKDWKIKKSKEGIFGNFFKTNNRYLNYIRKKNYEKKIFLRKLFLRKNLVLLKKNFAPNFYFYSYMLNSFLKYKYSNFYMVYNTNILNHLKVFPDFSHKKQILNNFIIFKKIIKEKDLNYFFCYKNLGNNGNNVIIFDNSNSSEKILVEKLKEELKKEEKKTVIFSLKELPTLYNNKTSLSIFTSPFFNFNLHINYNLEIYKIIIYVYIYNLK